MTGDGDSDASGTAEMSALSAIELRARWVLFEPGDGIAGSPSDDGLLWRWFG